MFVCIQAHIRIKQSGGIPLIKLLLLLLSHFSHVRLCATPSPGILQARTLEWAAISFSNA